MGDILDHLPRGPYSMMTTAAPGKHDGNGHVYITDRDGRKIGVCWGRPDEKIALATLIIEARGAAGGGG